MLKTGIILIFRKLRSHLVTGFLFAIGLAIGYVWLVTAMFHTDWFGLAGSIIIIVTTTFRGYPILSKKDSNLYKIFGAHKKNIVPFILIQVVIIALITTVLALAIMGVVNNGLFISFESLQSAGKQWLLVIGTGVIIVINFISYYRLFAKAQTSIS